jgi:hypothetical protein
LSENKEVRTATAATQSKHDPTAVFQKRRASLRSRTHAKPTPDGRYKCMECGFISNTLEEADAHHFRTHERQPAQTYMGTPPWLRFFYRKIEKGICWIIRETSVRQWIVMKLNKVDEKVYQTLKAEGKELSLQELTEKTGEPTKKVFKSLKKFFEHEIIETKARKYSLTGKDPKAAKEETPEPPE